MQIAPDSFSWFDVPEQVKKLLIQAAQSWENTQESEQYINQALEITNNNIDVLVAAYRYFYYKHNYLMALKAAENVMLWVQKNENLPSNQQELKQIILQRLHDAEIRLYINAYSASGLILAKLGKVETAQEICQFIQEIDVNHEYLSAEILLDVLTRSPEEED
ncbi:hypothetical protein [Calothrix sp. NIES-3974]|uniref:hypothetical protein n=1 Tax=Calothrix sp. NIES-3974 TaxID=2005462 RepID=UPI000B5E53BD|nr:hypothetical protein [Calothrix sp. NIES-3974]BAZ06616.1 hypothetical protein NIES3974_32770 [Calothrix sp. NIES-3974]